MRRRCRSWLSCFFLGVGAAAFGADRRASDFHEPIPLFRTSDRCVACHNGLTAPSGEDISIGIDWRASIMANSARDPYWQASVRRETLDHPESKAQIEDECAGCHMPMARYHAKSEGRKGVVFEHLEAGTETLAKHEALDGVSCSLCHQMSAEKLGEPVTFSGQFIIASPPAGELRAELGPFDIDAGLERIMRSSSGGFRPTKADHIRKSELCASCHTLHTTALGRGGSEIGSLPEQTPYQEWQHSAYANERSCQSCHMPLVPEAVAISRVLGEPRSGMSRHVFVGGNFFMQRMLATYREDLGVVALPAELNAAAHRTVEHLQSSAARVTIGNLAYRQGNLDASVHVQNLGGHKLPTAYPSRRVWLHVLVTDDHGAKVFESGSLNADGSIQGNDNDEDATKFEPHYRTIRRADQVQVFESVLSDAAGQVTTGLLNATGYLKDNRLLPRGFDKRTADSHIAVHGEALDDPAFDDAGSTVTYSIAASGVASPLTIRAELLYQPIGYRWAHNLAPYDAAEPKRFVAYFDSMKSGSAVVLATAEATARQN